MATDVEIEGFIFQGEEQPDCTRNVDTFPYTHAARELGVAQDKEIALIIHMLNGNQITSDQAINYLVDGLALERRRVDQ